jgi:hypothetical protein
VVPETKGRSLEDMEQLWLKKKDQEVVNAWSNYKKWV